MVRRVLCSGCGLAPSPPAEKTAARQDQAGQSGTGDEAGDSVRRDAAGKCGGIGTKNLSSKKNAAIKANMCSLSRRNYTVDETNKTLLTRVEGSIYPNNIGIEQKRVIISLTTEELKYSNPVTSFGAKAHGAARCRLLDTAGMSRPFACASTVA